MKWLTEEYILSYQIHLSVFVFMYNPVSLLFWPESCWLSRHLLVLAGCPSASRMPIGYTKCVFRHMSPLLSPYVHVYTF